MKTLMLILVAFCAISFTSAESFRLKYQTTVDVLDDSGTKTGVKKLPAGSVVTLGEVSTPSSKADSDKKRTMASGTKKTTKLKPSDISPIMWKNTHPEHVVLRAEIKLDSDYYGSFENLKKTHWSVRVCLYDKDWENYEMIYAYAEKTSQTGKKIQSALGDGKERRALVKLMPTKEESDETNATLEDFELLPTPKD